MIQKSLQLLEQILAGHQVTAAELDDLIASQVREDLFLEYKHGMELTNNDAASTIREYVSGFANSTGGLLIFGVEAPDGAPISVTGCHNHKKGNLVDWAARCLTPIAHYFSPPPQIRTLTHPKGEVLYIAVERSPGFIPLVEAGIIVYYLRLQDQTLRAPEYLMADLLVGRRQQPSLGIDSLRAVNLKRVLDHPNATMDIELVLRWRIENKSIVWSQDTQWGLITWVKYAEARYPHETSSPSDHLLSYIDVRDVPTERFRAPMQLLRFGGHANVYNPFDADSKSVYFTVPLRVLDEWFTYTSRAALYLVSRNGVPVWHQIQMAIDATTIKAMDERGQLQAPNDGLTILRLFGERPIVSME